MSVILEEIKGKDLEDSNIKMEVIMKENSKWTCQKVKVNKRITIIIYMKDNLWMDRCLKVLYAIVTKRSILDRLNQQD